MNWMSKFGDCIAGLGKSAWEMNGNEKLLNYNYVCDYYNYLCDYYNIFVTPSFSSFLIDFGKIYFTDTYIMRFDSDWIGIVDSENPF